MKPSLFLLPFLFLTPFVVDSILSDEDEMDAHDRGAHTYRFDLNREPYEHYHDFGSNQAETSNASHNRRRHHYNRSRNDRHDRYRDSDTETSDTDEESGSRRIHLGHDGYEPFHAYNPQQHHHEFGSNHAESSNASLSRSRNNRYNRSQNRTNESAYNYNRRRMLSFNRRMAYDREYIQNLHLNYNRNLSLYSPQQQQINSGSTIIISTFNSRKNIKIFIYSKIKINKEYATVINFFFIKINNLFDKMSIMLFNSNCHKI
ncbi:unnamed protein product [Meloidogyne enterolobii]|uniref:Uncharacterized protein n=1 Tax=Meloidogyne enterolobii TaxID=390850 RepID=A0ACB1B548_MELEN